MVCRMWHTWSGIEYYVGLTIEMKNWQMEIIQARNSDGLMTK